MIYSKEFSKAAIKDIRKTNQYLKDTLKNRDAASRLVISTEAKVNDLIIFPFQHPIVQDPVLKLYKIRYAQIKNYLIFYTVDENSKIVYIVRFLYARSDWKNILKKSIKFDEHLSEITGGYVHEEQEEFGKQFKKEPSIMTEPINNQNNNENYNEENARQELYNELKKGLDDIEAGCIIPAEEVHTRVAKKFEGYDFK